MSRSLPEPIGDLSEYPYETVTLGQAADYLMMDRRAVAGLVKGGVLARKIREVSNREFHIYTWSLREFDGLRFKRTA